MRSLLVFSALLAHVVIFAYLGGVLPLPGLAVI